MKKELNSEEIKNGFHSLVEQVIPQTDTEEGIQKGRNSMASRFLLDSSEKYLNILLEGMGVDFKRQVYDFRKEYRDMEVRRMKLGALMRENFKNSNN